MLRAGSLTYALFLALVISIFCFLMISLVHLNRTVFIRSDISFQLEDALQSSLAKSRLWFGDRREAGQSEFNGFNTVVSHRNWGPFEVSSAQVISDGRKLSRSVVLAYDYPDQNLALYQKDENNSLSLAGKALINGDAFLSSKGIKTAFIGGKPLENDKLITGELKVSGNRLPSLPYNYNEYWKSYLFGATKAMDSLSRNSFSKSIRHPFWKKTLVMQSRSSVQLDQVNWHGNIILVSESLIEVSSKSDLQNVILIAPSIKIAAGAKISAHLIATNHIEVGDSTLLEFPSSISALHLQKNEATVKLNAAVRLEGSILHLSELPYRNNNIHLDISPDAQVLGTIYCKANTQLEGEVIGQVFARYFLVKTQSAVYEDVLMDGRINRKDYPDELLFMRISPDSKQRIAAIL